jgi:hypothetical protein
VEIDSPVEYEVFAAVLAKADIESEVSPLLSPLRLKLVGRIPLTKKFWFPSVRTAAYDLGAVAEDVMPIGMFHVYGEAVPLGVAP